MSGGQDAGAPQRTATRAGRGNQAAIEAMSPPAPDCALGDDACGFDVAVDDILGEGAEDDIQGVIGEISDLVAGVFLRLGDTPDPSLDEWFPHLDGALNLNGLLNVKTVALLASARWDDAGEVSWSEDLEGQVWDALERGRKAIEVLKAIRLLVDAEKLEALAAAVSSWAATGRDALEMLRIRAQSGTEMLGMLLAEYQERRPIFEKHLAAASKDAASFFVGPLGKLVRVEEDLKRVWSLANAFNAVQADPKKPWETIKTIKTVGFTAAGEFVRLLDKQDPFRVGWTGLTTLVNTTQLLIDTGAAAREGAVLYKLGEQAKAVRDEYAGSMALYSGREKEIAQAVAALSRVSKASEVLDTRMTAARATVAAAGADSTDFYYPFS